MDKKLLRKTHIQSMGMLDDARMRKIDADICAGVLSMDEYKDAKSVFLYISVGKEVSTDVLVRKALEDGKHVYIPQCMGNGIMHAARLEDLSRLVDGMYGIPTVESGNCVIEPDALDFILVPGVCFDITGHRLGRGGGYYDRYLAQNIRAYTVGVCRNAQLLESMQVDEHDRGVDAVVTQDKILRFKKQ